MHSRYLRKGTLFMKETAFDVTKQTPRRLNIMTWLSLKLWCDIPKSNVSFYLSLLCCYIGVGDITHSNVFNVRLYVELVSTHAHSVHYHTTTHVYHHTTTICPLFDCNLLKLVIYLLIRE